tara:strand:+ start:341 stop:784 length:444 start_codon:yes stop_codon:yes gene_type:complete
MLQNSFQDLFKNLLILVLSYGLAMYMVVYLLDFPSWILSSPKIIKNYYYTNFTKNVILDYIYILGYLGIAFFIMDQFNITSNASKFLTVIAVTGTLTATFAYLFRNVFTNVKVFSKFFQTVGYKSCIYDIVYVVFIYYLYEFLKNKL